MFSIRTARLAVQESQRMLERVAMQVASVASLVRQSEEVVRGEPRNAAHQRRSARIGPSRSDAAALEIVDHRTMVSVREP